MFFVNLLQTSRDFFQRIFPTRGFQSAVAPDERLAHALGVVSEIKTEASFRAQEFAVDAGMIPIVSAKNFIVAHAKGRLATVRTVRARIRNIFHFPRPRLITVSSARERADWANIDAHAALFASQLARFVRQNHGIHAARTNAQRLHVHAFIANAHAAEAQNAPRRIVINQRRPFFFRVMQFFFIEAAVVQPVAKSHVLQFALAALVANRTIERMIRKQELDHVLACFVNLRRIGLNNHAFHRDERARSL